MCFHNMEIFLTFVWKTFSSFKVGSYKKIIYDDFGDDLILKNFPKGNGCISQVYRLAVDSEMRSILLFKLSCTSDFDKLVY